MRREDDPGTVRLLANVVKNLGEPLGRPCVFRPVNRHNDVVAGRYAQTFQDVDRWWGQVSREAKSIIHDVAGIMRSFARSSFRHCA